MYHWQISSSIQWVVFSFCCAKTFYFDIVPFVYFFISLALGAISEKILLQEMSKILLPMVSSRIFMVSSLTFKSLIHFEFILVHGVRRWSNFIPFAHMCLIFPALFIKKTVFTPKGDLLLQKNFPKY